MAIGKIRGPESGDGIGMGKKMGARDCKVRAQKPRPQICVVSKVTFGQVW